MRFTQYSMRVAEMKELREKLKQAQARADKAEKEISEKESMAFPAASTSTSRAVEFVAEGGQVVGASQSAETEISELRAQLMQARARAEQAEKENMTLRAASVAGPGEVERRRGAGKVRESE